MSDYPAAVYHFGVPAALMDSRGRHVTMGPMDLVWNKGRDVTSRFWSQLVPSGIDEGHKSRMIRRLSSSTLWFWLNFPRPIFSDHVTWVLIRWKDQTRALYVPKIWMIFPGQTNSVEICQSCQLCNSAPSCWAMWRVHDWNRQSVKAKNNFGRKM